MHSSSFSYGQHAAGQAGESNGAARTPSLSGQSTPVQEGGAVRGSELSSIGLPLHRPHVQHTSIADHEGGPGKSHHSPTAQAGAGLNVASAFRPVSSHGQSSYAGPEGQTATAASPGNRSISAARFTQQPSSSYALATPNYNTASAGGGEGLAFYDGGRQVTGISGTANNGAGSPYQHRVSSAHRSSPSGERHRLSGELAGSRPGTSGGVLTSSGGTGRSASHGRSGLYKRRF
jgi:hypothetical protein